MANKAIWNFFSFAVFLPVLLGTTFAQTTTPSHPNIFAITLPNDATASRKIMCISSNATTALASLGGKVLYGMDDDSIAFLQTPATPPAKGSRLLVISRTTCAILADTNVTGFIPDSMKALNVERLAVCSKQSIVYIPAFDGHTFSVFQANWNTGTTRLLSVPVSEGAEHWEITALYALPSAVAIERGPFLILFDPATQTPVLTLNNRGPDLRPGSVYYAVPGYGLVESVKGRALFYRVTEKDFSTQFQNPEGFPTLELNIDKHHHRLAHVINGKPCLLWGEHKTGETPNLNTISQIAIFNLNQKNINLRLALGAALSPIFLPDRAGQNIFVFNQDATEVFSIDVKSETITSFAKPGSYRFETWVAAN